MVKGRPDMISMDSRRVATDDLRACLDGLRVCVDGIGDVSAAFSARGGPREARGVVDASGLLVELRWASNGVGDFGIWSEARRKAFNDCCPGSCVEDSVACWLP